MRKLLTVILAISAGYVSAAEFSGNVAITTDYRFETPSGAASLRDLFGEHAQLVVMHFMLGPGWVDGCPMCSFWADNYNGTIEHLATVHAVSTWRSESACLAHLPAIKGP